MVAEIVQLGGLDDEDEKYQEFIEGLRDGNVRAVYLIEKEDGTIRAGTNATQRRDIVYDLYRLQELCRMIINEAE